MIVRNLKWGYRRGRCACGLESGTDIVELMLTEGYTKKYVFVAMRNEYETYARDIVIVHHESLFDAAMDMSMDDLLSEKKDVELMMEYDMIEDPAEGWARYLQPIRLAYMALRAWRAEGYSGKICAEEFIAPYAGRDVEGLELEEAFSWIEFLQKESEMIAVRRESRYRDALPPEI